MKKMAAKTIAIIASLLLMALVADIFGAYLTALVGIASYKFFNWAEMYFMSIDI